MDRQESQGNWPEMRKTLGKPGFLSGEDRNRTTYQFPGKIEVPKRGGAKSDARRKTGCALATRATAHEQNQLSIQRADLWGHMGGIPIATLSAFQFVSALRRFGGTQGNAET